MNNDKNPTNTDNAVINNDEQRGLNENEKYEDSRNNYQNDEPLKERESAKNTSSNAVDDDIAPLENGPQKNPGSCGAFPVGAFDTGKD